MAFPKVILAVVCAAMISGFPDTVAALQSNSDVTVKVSYKNKSYVGKPLAWDGDDMMLLRRDGKITILPVKKHSDYETIDDRFQPYETDVMRSKLQREFGRKYQVSITRNFVVVHPIGSFRVWAMPFEELYARFDAYFSSRGFTLDEPEFPMVAVVLRTRNEFDHFLRAYHDYDSKILGYYSPTSNRIITYDQQHGKAKDQSWFFNADTIIHEATHQTAFNTGVHSRYCPVPRWISEGLAMLFEAPGVNNSRYYTKQRDRINRIRLLELQSYYRKDEVQGRVAELITSDRLFRTDPSLAYAISWGLTFYLSEKMPPEYQTFLRADGQKTNFSTYSSRQRSKAFADAFGPKISEIDARMENFVRSLDVPEPRRKR
jgi:hypothetical protein